MQIVLACVPFYPLGFLKKSKLQSIMLSTNANKLSLACSKHLYPLKKHILILYFFISLQVVQQDRNFPITDAVKSKP